MGKRKAKDNNDPITLSTAEQAKLFDLVWRLRDATERRDWRELRRLRLELLSLFDLTAAGQRAGSKLYAQRGTEPAPKTSGADTLTMIADLLERRHGAPVGDEDEQPATEAELAELRSLWGDDGVSE